MSPTSSKLLLSPSPLPLVLVLLTSVLSVSGESIGCRADLTISGTEQAKITDNGQPLGNNLYRYLYTYVDPMDGFKGVNVVAKMKGNSFNAWFPLTKECFTYDTVTWWRMLVVVNIQTSGNHNIINFLLKTGSCAFECTISVTFRNVLELEVVAHGPSRWRYNEPDRGSCDTRDENQTDGQLRNCLEPPLPESTTPRHLPHNTTPKPGTTSTPATTFAPVHTPSLATAPDKNTGPVAAPSSDEDTTDPVTRRNVVIVVVVVAVVVVLVVVVAAVVVVVMIKRYLQRRETKEKGVVMRRTQDASSSSEMVVIENSLYEPFENFRPPQSTDG